MYKNKSGQIVQVQMLNLDGTPFTGSATCHVLGDGGTQAVGSVGSGAMTHEGNGLHSYAPAQAETNYDKVSFTGVGTGAANASVHESPIALVPTLSVDGFGGVINNDTTGSLTYDLVVKDGLGVLTDVDSDTVTWTMLDGGNADKTARLSGATKVSTGRYRITASYTVAEVKPFSYKPRATVNINSVSYEVEGVTDFSLDDAAPTTAEITAAVRVDIERENGVLKDTQDAVGFPTADSLAQDIADIPTLAAFNARTLPAADYFVVGDYTDPPTAAAIASNVEAELLNEATGEAFKQLLADSIAADWVVGDASPIAVAAAVAARSDFATLFTDAAAAKIASEAAATPNDVLNQATAALITYDPPTNAEMVARTLLAADYFDPAGDAVATVTTLTGHTAQTGDSYGRIGAPAGASISADIAAVDASGGGLDAAGVRAAVGLSTANLDTQLADLPTVAEFTARTLVTADYFDPAADAVANVTNVGTLTNYTTPPTTTEIVTAVAADGGVLDLARDAAVAVKAALDAMAPSGVFTTESVANVAGGGLDSAGAQAAAEAAIDAKLPSGATLIAGAGATATDLDDVGSTGAVPPFLNRKVPSALTVDVGTRADGRANYNKIRLAPGERRVVQWEYDNRISEGVNNMTLPVSDDVAVVTVIGTVGTDDRWGVENNHAKVEVLVPSDATIGATTLIRCDIKPEGDEVDKAVMQIEVFDPAAGL